MTKNTSAIDHILILSAQNYQGNSMVQAARKGASQGALDQAAKIFCDNIVKKAHAEYKKTIDGTHDETSASFTLSNGAEYLRELAQTGLSQETKDYILQKYLSVGILRNAVEVAEFGTSREALGELRRALIKGGEPRGLAEIVANQKVPLQTWEIDALIDVCVKKHLEYNAHILIEAIKLGASPKARKHAVREFIKKVKKQRQKGDGSTSVRSWTTLLEILGGYWFGPKEMLDDVVMMIVEDIRELFSGNEDSCLSVNGHERLRQYVECGVQFIKLGPAEHVTDFFIQELMARRLWEPKDAFMIADRCSSMLVESLTRATLGKARAKRIAIQTGCAGYSEYTGTDLENMLKKLAKMAKYASEGLKKAVLEELLENSLTDEAVEFASTIGI